MYRWLPARAETLENILGFVARAIHKHVVRVIMTAGAVSSIKERCCGRANSNGQLDLVDRSI